MDIRLSQDDRVGSQSPRARAPQKKPAKRQPKGERGRIEPTFGGGAAALVADDRGNRGRRGRGGRGEKPSRRSRKRWTLGGFFLSILYWVFIASIWGGIAVAGVIVYYAVQLPSADTWAVPDRPANIRIVASDGQLISNRGQMGGEAVSLRELPHYVTAAVIAIEDRRFMTHFGVDPIGLAAVALESIEAGRVTRGASTLTQQLAKNLFLSPDQTLGRKVQEALLSLWLEQNYSKEQILELYLNRVFFGHNSYGIEAAAQTYYGISARNLSLGQAATLAGLLQAPTRLNPKSDPEAAATRQRLVLRAMAEEGYITAQEADAAAIDPNTTDRTRVAGAEYYVADWVESLMTAYLGEIKQDVIVSTTINWDLQKQAEFIVREAVADEGASRGFTQGALVAMEVDGTVRAMVGGVDYAQSQYNRAVTARRQPGSTFKPFVYLAAMEKGYTPDTVADDSPFSYQGWSPDNASHQYRGPVTLREGLAFSLNTIAARLAIDVTPQVVVDTAMRLGISSPMQPVASIALGTQEVSLLELTAAYAPFANGGEGVIANVITKIETADGEVLYEATPGGPGQVIDPQIVAEMNDMLMAAVQIGTARGASLSGWEIGGKTGTSQNARDALFMGFSSHMVAGVWLGNDDNAGTTLSGGNVPAQIWTEFMAKAHAGVDPAPLPHGGYASIEDIPFYDPNTGQTFTLDQTQQPGAVTPDQPVPNQMVQPDAPLQPVDQMVQEPTAQQSEGSQRTLMDIIFGN